MLQPDAFLALIHFCGRKIRQEIAEGSAQPGRIRRLGAGRKSMVERDPKLLAALDRLIEPEARGDPESPLRWICKSTRNLAAQLTRKKHPVSHEKVAQLLRAQNYSLQSNRKTEEGADHPDRDAQFRYISAQVKKALAAGTPVISVDTKKKELLGNYENRGKQWLPAKNPVKVNGHDFPSPEVPRAYPYGIYVAIAATTMRRVLVDHAKARQRGKRDNNPVKVPLDEISLGQSRDPVGILDLDSALQRLAQQDSRKAHLVELFYFGGVNCEEASLMLNVSVATVNRDLKFARAWLRQELQPDASQR